MVQVTKLSKAFNLIIRKKIDFFPQLFSFFYIFSLNFPYLSFFFLPPFLFVSPQVNKKTRSGKKILFLSSLNIYRNILNVKRSIFGNHTFLTYFVSGMCTLHMSNLSANVCWTNWIFTLEVRDKREEVKSFDSRFTATKYLNILTLFQ